MEKKKRGGKRAGAGRPTEGITKKVSLTLTAGEWEMIEKSGEKNVAHWIKKRLKSKNEKGNQKQRETEEEKAPADQGFEFEFKSEINEHVSYKGEIYKTRNSYCSLVTVFVEGKPHSLQKWYFPCRMAPTLEMLKNEWEPEFLSREGLL